MTDKRPLHNWSLEKLALKSKAEIEIIRQRAVDKNVSDLVAMCDSDLAARKPLQKIRDSSTQAAHSSDDVVTGYHFVCQRGRGVTEQENGKFWTGAWVVAESNVTKSLKYYSYVALHESKTDLSYRQGKILGYRRSARDMLADKNNGETKTEEGIEFLVEEEAKSYSWIGGGTGEKGYQWSRISSLAPSSLQDRKES